MSRTRYIIRRLLLAIPTFIGITLVCFALTRILPGGPVEIRLMRMRGLGGGGTSEASAVATVTENQRQQLTQQFGFDKPFLVQYTHWLLHDRMGLRMRSYDYPDRTAGQLIANKIPISLWFGLTGFLLSYLLCIPLGIAKALRHGTPLDWISSLIIFAAYAIPPFTLGMLLKTLLCGTVDGLWDILPLGGTASYNAAHLTGWAAFTDRARHMLLPVLCYIVGNFAMLTLMMKNALMEQITSDYIRTILAKGGSRTRAVWRHALRNALIPIATGFGSILGVLFAGSVIIETIFEIPGMGRLSLDALTGHDYAIFMAILALTSLLQLAGNLLSDICYMLIDPRIHFD